MVKIRLQRGGAKKRPFFRVIAIDERKKRDGRALEFLGTYNPVPRPSEISLKLDRIEAWEKNGAKLSDAVQALVKQARRQPPAEVASAPEPTASAAGSAEAAPAAEGGA